MSETNTVRATANPHCKDPHNEDSWVKEFGEFTFVWGAIRPLKCVEFPLSGEVLEEKRGLLCGLGVRQRVPPPAFR